MEAQQENILLYYIKQLSPSDAACSKQIKLPRTKAKKFVGDLRHKQRAIITFMDQREVLWEFLCTCYGCQYALSRVAVFCNTYQLRAGQHLIFYRDGLKRLRIAVISNMPGKLLQQLATCSDNLPCKQQLLLPELAYPSSSEEPTDTLEADDYDQPHPAAQQPPAALPCPVEAAAAAEAPAWQGAAGAAGHPQQPGQFVLQNGAAMAAVADGSVEVQAERSLASEVAATEAGHPDKFTWSPALQQQQHMQHQWRNLICSSEGRWAPAPEAAAAAAGDARVAAAAAEAPAVSAAPVAGASERSPAFSLSSPTGFNLVCEELLDELESPHINICASNLLQQQQTQQQAAVGTAGVAGAALGGSAGVRHQQLDVAARQHSSAASGVTQRVDQDQPVVRFYTEGLTAAKAAASGSITVAAVAARKSNRPGGCSSAVLQGGSAAASTAHQGMSGGKRQLEVPTLQSEQQQPSALVPAGCFNRLSGDCCYSSGPAGKRLRQGTCSFPADAVSGACGSAAAAGDGCLQQQQPQQPLGNGISHSHSLSSTCSSSSALSATGAGSVLPLFHATAAGGAPCSGAGSAAAPPTQQHSSSRLALPGGCRLLHTGSLVLDRGGGRAAAPVWQQQAGAGLSAGGGERVATGSATGGSMLAGQHLASRSKQLELEEWSAITGLLMLSGRHGCYAC